MADQQTEAASSPAEVVDPFKGEQPSLEEYSQYRKDGELPARFKPESESATDDTQEETEEAEAEEPEPEPDSEPEESQEQPKVSPAQKRIKQLLAENAELKRQQAAKPDGKTESSPVAVKEPTPEDLNADGTPKFKTYEEFTKALARHEAKLERAEWERSQAQQQASRELQTKLDEARDRYEDADEAIFPAADAVNKAQIPLAVKEVFSQSEHFVDLCYVVGSDPKELKDFIRLAETNPRAAIGKIFEYERGIQEELSKDVKRDAQGKFVPEGNKTRAPKPASTVGGTSVRAFDANDETLSPEVWFQKRNAELVKKRGY